MKIRGLLLDLEGVLYEEDRPITGAVAALRRFVDGGLLLRGLTNTTTKPRRVIAARLQDFGFPLAEAQIFTPAAAARRLLQSEGLRRVHLATPCALSEDFAEFELVEEDAEAVVLGDLHLGFTWARLNELFVLLRQGAKLVALHRNRVCRRGGEIALDLGPFVAALEYASGQPARVVGKPAPGFFELALADLGLAPDQAVMVGDDIEADIGGAQAAGIYAVQVQTGKYTEADRRHPRVRPDALIASLADLDGVLSDQDGTLR